MLNKASSTFKNVAAQSRLAAITQAPQRQFSGGGPKKAAMPATETDFDVIFVGGVNATAVLKFMQNDDVNYKMALITDKSRYILPQSYFGVSHGHLTELKLESGTVSAQIAPWSRTDTQAKVTKFLPE
jgi:hypothetical protein